MKKFFDRIETDESTGCWMWTGEKKVNGYGRLRVDGKRVGAHRLSWTIHNGEIPDGLLVCHKCDTPSCVNPSHLFLGTHQNNTDDMIAKGRKRRDSMWGITKLTHEIVAEIRAHLSDGLTQYEVADRYGLHQSSVSRISRCETWQLKP